MADIFLYECAGTAVLLVLGVGVVANQFLPKTGGHGGGPLMIHFGWGLAVFAGVFVAYKTNAHINPAVTIGLLVSDAPEYAPGIPKTIPNTFAYLAAQLVGGVIGAVFAWLAYKKHYDAAVEPGEILATFATNGAIRSPLWNAVTEIIATFILVLVILIFGETPHEMGPLAVALLVVSLGASLGGPTGYAINPARDLGPRIAHQLLPIPHKGTSNWGYAWVPIVGPLVGGAIAGFASGAFL